MGIFRKKCAYCNCKIARGKEVFRDVKVPGFIGTKNLAFMNEEHADLYEKEITEHMKNQKSCGGSCCS